MRKHLLVIGTLAFALFGAQNTETLKKELEKQNRENNEKFDAFIVKQYGTAQKSASSQLEIQNQRSLLAGFSPDGIPYFYQTDDVNQINNSNSDHLQNGTIAGLNGAFNGENISFTIFDGGRAANTGRVFARHTLFDNRPGRIINHESNDMNHGGHATSVAGFIGAKSFIRNGINYKGIAPASTIHSYAFSNTRLPGENTEKTVFEKILVAQPNISNHSYGINNGWDLNAAQNGWVWNGAYNNGVSFDLQGAYFTQDQNYDRIVYANPSYIIVKSAGNYFGYGPLYPGTANWPKFYKNGNAFVQFNQNNVLPQTNCALGYDCIGSGSLAKNIIVVGANDIIASNGGRYNVSADVIHSSYSSAGPRDDGGIKPDISAVGTGVSSGLSAENLNGSNEYTTGSGTSYSAPVVTGIIGLWTQINKQLFNNAEFNAASAKTLMVHSASEAGNNPGPDVSHGWGFINAKKGAELLVGKSNNTVTFNDETLNNRVTNSKNIKASGTEPLKVTISWIDPEYVLPDVNVLTWNDVNNNRASKLVNDLDLRIIDTVTNTVYFPWKLDVNNPMAAATKADNTVDNVEQVIIDAPVAGRSYRIEVTHKGNLINNNGNIAPQNYSILVTGFDNKLIARKGTEAEKSRSSASLVIAPTITKDIVKILRAPEKSVYSIYDLSGKKLQNGIINGEEESLHLSSFVNGIYIIEVKTDKETVNKKVIKE
ncbi:S8 family peptidase [Chryseobacterium kwangjuense]|uniref:Secretion protein Por n=1 Tax=Chryseobacterium kwangjuense TaxID=267125 RepID=A0A135WI14_9FLAO|nr:S8 family peptidase [Chryseobacterium kwangjuense]KXH84510.1 secretion protein Por [Chryseobacterium kwangjuense]